MFVHDKQKLHSFVNEYLFFLWKSKPLFNPSDRPMVILFTKERHPLSNQPWDYGNVQLNCRITLEIMHWASAFRSTRRQTASISLNFNATIIKQLADVWLSEGEGGCMLKIQVFFSTSWKQTAYQAVSLGSYSIANLDISETLRSNFHHIFR